MLALNILQLAFCGAYLIFVWVLLAMAGSRYGRLSAAQRFTALLVLICIGMLASGDSAHLVPRILSGSMTLQEPSSPFAFWIGLGRALSSLTLSIFYFCLVIYAQRKFKLTWNAGLTALGVVFGVRVVLLAFPQNQWMGDAPTEWMLYRNIPFGILGLGAAGLLFYHAGRFPAVEASRLRGVGWSVLASFLFYFGTLIGGLFHPAWGALMIPKTLAYVAVVIWLYQLEFGMQEQPSGSLDRRVVSVKGGEGRKV